MLYLFRDKNTMSPVYIVNNAFPPEMCDEIIKIYKDKTATATHQGDDGEIVTSTKDGPRNSSVAWFRDQNVHAHLWEFVQAANWQTGWRYDIKDSELFQFTKYEGATKQHYNWHIDGCGCHHAARNHVFGESKNLTEINQASLAGTVRKISVSAILNDGFKGGDFEVSFLDNSEYVTRKIKAKKGDVLVFPSYLRHRVAPVTKGTRYSEVAWFGGPPFK